MNFILKLFPDTSHSSPETALGWIGKTPKAIHSRLKLRRPSLEQRWSHSCSDRAQVEKRRRFVPAAGAMAMAVQSPLWIDSLSNGFMGMGLNTGRPATQVITNPPSPSPNSVFSLTNSFFYGNPTFCPWRIHRDWG
jgi:hypothetical protein